MSDPTLDVIRHVQTNDPITAAITSQPTRALEERLLELEARLNSASTTSLTGILLRTVSVKSDVGQNDVVYYNPDNNRYEKAIADVTLKTDVLVHNPSSLAVGMVWNKISTTKADILVGGYAALPAGINDMMEAGETFSPGYQYYLSAKTPGKVTRYAPIFKVQVFLTDNTYLIINQVYSNPDAVDLFYRRTVGMRPVGSIRTVPKENNRFQIVGFDAIEKYTANANTYYRSTRDSDVVAVKNFGYLVADASVAVQPATPVYVRVHVAASTGVITVTSAKTFSDVSQATSLIVNTGSSDATTSPAQLLTASSGTYTFIIKDATLLQLGVMSFRFTTSDVTYDRDVYLKFPDSFQGWKMINPPTTVAATSVVDATSNGHVIGVTITNGGTGFITPPLVTFSAPGSGSTATGTAVINDLGVVTGVTVTSGGTGYSSNTPPTVTFTGGIATGSLVIVDEGSGYTTDPTVVASLPDIAGGATAIVTATISKLKLQSIDRLAVGTNYTSAPTVVIEGPWERQSDGTRASGTADAVATCDITTKSVTAVDVTGGGTHFTTIPTITFADPTGVGAGAAITAGKDVTARAVAVMNDAGTSVDHIEVTHGGAFYDTNPTYVWANLGGQTAPTTTVTCAGDRHLTNFAVGTKGLHFPAELVVADVEIVTGGVGYAGTGISSGGGTISGTIYNHSATPAQPALVTATVAGGALTRIMVMDRGYGFTYTPTGTDSANSSGYGIVWTGVTSTTAATYNVITYNAPLIGVKGGGQATATFDASVRTGGLNNGAPVALVTGVYTAGGVLGTDAYSGSGGNGYTKPPIVVFYSATGQRATAYSTLGDGTSATNYTATDAVYSITITDGGTGYTDIPVIGFLDGGQVKLQAQCSASLATLTLGDPGSGYISPPVFQITGGGSNPSLQRGSIACSLSGEGGWLSDAKLQVTSYGDDLNDGNVVFAKPNLAEFYYNIKADPSLLARWPAIPVDRCSFLLNGIEALSSKLNESTATFDDADADVGLSRKTLYWTTSHVDGCPWDHLYESVKKDGGPAGKDNVLYGTNDTGTTENWVWWEHTYKYEPFRNKAWAYINKLSRSIASSKVMTLSAQAPLRLIDMNTGIDSNSTGVPMTGQLMVTLDDRASIFTDPSVQFDLAQEAGPQAIWQNNTGKNVFISSIVLQTIYQKIVDGQVVQADGDAKVTVGTAGGNFRDIVGQFVTGSTDNGVNTKLLASSQFKQLFPDATSSSAVVAPNDVVYLQVVSAAASPIISQLCVARMTGFIF